MVLSSTVLPMRAATGATVVALISCIEQSMGCRMVSSVSGGSDMVCVCTASDEVEEPNGCFPDKRSHRPLTGRHTYRSHTRHNTQHTTHTRLSDSGTLIEHWHITLRGRTGPYSRLKLVAASCGLFVASRHPIGWKTATIARGECDASSFDPVRVVCVDADYVCCTMCPVRSVYGRLSVLRWIH